jgi:hypothetical protein
MPYEPGNPRPLLAIDAADPVAREPRKAARGSLGIAQLHQAFDPRWKLERNNNGHDVLLNLVDRGTPVGLGVDARIVARDKIG